MDVLAGLLDGPRARGAFLLRSLLEPPWSLRIQDEAPLTLVALVRGHGWVLRDHADPVLLRPGDVAAVKGPEHYTVADHPDTAPQVVIHPGQRCTTPAGQDLHQAMDLGVRTWGNHAQGCTMLLTGTYQLQGEISSRLFGVLPALVVVPADPSHAPLISLLGAEMARDDPGQEAVLDRLLDLLLIAVLRAWFNRPESDAPAWYVAHGDPIVGPVLRLLYNDPSSPWTVAALAARAGVSRAGLARRFSALVGEPPMRFLAEWRVALAADLLREPDATVAAVAHQVGYGSPYALSTAFKRVRGVSPKEHRQRP